MRKIIKIFLFTIIAVLFVSCISSKKRIEKLWNIEASVNYQNFTEEENRKIEKLFNQFASEEKENRLEWNSGYSQQFFLLRKLYYLDIITLSEFLDKCLLIYERYESFQNQISFHTMGYAVSLYYAGNIGKANDIFHKIINDSSVQDFNSDVEYKLVFSVCSKLVGFDNCNNSQIEEDYYNMSKEDIINTFCGN